MPSSDKLVQRSTVLRKYPAIIVARSLDVRPARSCKRSSHLSAPNKIRRGAENLQTLNFYRQL
jgi:hypothetical protein